MCSQIKMHFDFVIKIAYTCSSSAGVLLEHITNDDDCVNFAERGGRILRRAQKKTNVFMSDKAKIIIRHIGGQYYDFNLKVGIVLSFVKMSTKTRIF